MSDRKYLYQFSNYPLKDLADALCPIFKCIDCFTPTGVTQIVPGSPNVTVNPTTGTGIVEISVTEGGQTYIEVTYVDLVNLIDNEELVPGALYKVTGVNKNKPLNTSLNPVNRLPVILYDDGTNSGITVYAWALSTTELTSAGYGEFYNPRYVSYRFYDSPTGNGLYGIWDGDNPNSGSIPNYVINQVVFWGGYAWKNLSGDVGFAIDSYTLSGTDWEKLTYEDSHYVKVIDQVQVDWIHDLIVARYNPENQVHVKFSTQWYADLQDVINPDLTYVSPISRVCWGLYSLNGTGPGSVSVSGINNVLSIDSALECINFKGRLFNDIECLSSSFYSNYIGYESNLVSIKNINFSSFYFNSSIDFSVVSNITSNSSILNGNVFSTNSFFTECNFTFAQIEYNECSASQISYINCISDDKAASISYNTLDTSEIAHCILTQASAISYNTFTEGSISWNTLSQESFIANCIGTVGGSYITHNTLETESSIDQMEFDSANSYVFGNSLWNSNLQIIAFLYGAGIESNTFINSAIINQVTADSLTITIRYCNFSNTRLEQGITWPLMPSVGIFEYLTFDGPITLNSGNFDTATDIYLSGTKRIYTRTDGTIRLSYYTNSDTPTIVNIDA